MKLIRTRMSEQASVDAIKFQVESGLDTLLSTVETFEALDASPATIERMHNLKAQIADLKSQLAKLARPYPVNIAELIQSSLNSQPDKKLAYTRCQVNYPATTLEASYGNETALSVARVLVEHFKPQGFNVDSWEQLITV